MPSAQAAFPINPRNVLVSSGKGHPQPSKHHKPSPLTAASAPPQQAAMAFLKSFLCFRLGKSTKPVLEARDEASTQAPPEPQPSPPPETTAPVVTPSPPYDAEAWRRKADTETRPDPPTWKRLPLDKKLEEERNPGYRADTWYHVHIGEVINDRYQVCTKIGWGDTSTVWLAKDLRYVRRHIQVAYLITRK